MISIKELVPGLTEEQAKLIDQIIKSQKMNLVEHAKRLVQARWEIEELKQKQ
jgi:hypothetical protein